ncbi:uncharacterized protein LOC113376582 [Ctenocephalides felis]|uniref:uncharacterized protein LOC113376582 n=1 Tax=Ctenocephalides felis TaxID=7515 RepID=UPI000E6E20D2|nr:uncharacterized protein LOC113376582 [Ctenocephalides felis]
MLQIKIDLSCLFIFLTGLLLTTDGREDGVRVKRPRAPESLFGLREPPQEINHFLSDNPDERNNLPKNLQANVPPGFLSPSVREYLELGKSIPGRPGTDYPVLADVPYTNFYCDEQPYPGFFADMETRCQGWHYCDIDGRQATFLCPNGTQFSQAVFVCDWWFNVQCDLSKHLYSINARLYSKPRELDPTRPHRVITKQLLQDIFNSK